MQTGIRSIHFYSTQVAKFEKTPHFQLQDLGTVFLEGCKFMFPREGEPDKWPITKFHNHAENTMRLVLTDMSESAVYKEAAAKAAAEAKGEVYAPPAKKARTSKGNSDAVVVTEELCLQVDMGKKPKRKVVWLDDVQRMIDAAHDALPGENALSAEDFQKVKDFGVQCWFQSIV